MEEQSRKPGRRKEKPIVSVYDADFLPFYVCHNKKGEGYKTLDDCIKLCDQFIFNINKATACKYFVGFVTKGKCFRYKVNPLYKANRKYTYTPRYMNDVKDYLISKYSFLYDENYEADDLVLSFKKAMPDYRCVIVSPDKDILNSTDVAYNPRINKFVNNTEEQIKDYFWKSMITGDPIDGIKGIPGKGEVYYKKIIEENLGSHETYIPSQAIVLNAYLDHFGEYNGIKEFTKNYLSLKLVDDVELGIVKLNNVEELVCE